MILASENKGTFEPEIKIDRDSPIPLMFQLYRSILESLSSRRPAPGMKMPSERKISDTFDINRYSVHCVYQQLEHEGYLEMPEEKRGAFISPKVKKKYMPSAPCIGIILPFSFSYFTQKSGLMSMDYLRGIFDRAGERNFSTMIINLPSPDEAPQKVREWLEGLTSLTTGTIYFGDRGISNDLPLEMIMDCEAFPQFCMSSISSKDKIHPVLAEITPGITGALDLLKENGHSRIGFLRSIKPSSLYIINQYRNRITNFMEVAVKSSFHADERWVSDDSEEKGKLADNLKRIFSIDKTPTALMAQNDEIASNAIKILRDMGYRVPEDVSIIGYDDDPSIKENNEGFLTTIQHPRYEMGQTCVDMVEHFFDKPPNFSKEEDIKIPTHLIKGKSVGKAKDERES